MRASEWLGHLAGRHLLRRTCRAISVSGVRRKSTGDSYHERPDRRPARRPSGAPQRGASACTASPRSPTGTTARAGTVTPAST